MLIYTVCKLLSNYLEVINSYLNSFENAVDFYCAEKNSLQSTNTLILWNQLTIIVKIT